MAGKQGFAALTKEQRRELASRGGKKAKTNGTAHRWTREEAQQAARKAHQARAANKLARQPQTQPQEEQAPA